MRTRVNPRVNRDLPEQNVPDPGHRSAHGEEVALMLQSPGWAEVVAGNLRRRLAAIEHELAIGNRMDLDAIRRKQIEHELYRTILEDPMAFFTAEV